MDDRAARRDALRRSLRIVSGWAAFLCTTAGCLALFHFGFERAGIESARINLDVVRVLERFERLVAKADADPDSLPVAFTGDSLIRRTLGLAHRGRLAIPRRLEIAVRKLDGTSRVQIIPLCWGGLSPLENYYLTDAIIASGARNVLISFNLVALSGVWKNMMGRVELAGWIAPGRLPSTSRLPLARFGLTADRLLLYVALRNLGAISPWRWLRGEQTRAAKLADVLREFMGAESQSRELLRLGTEAWVRRGPKEPPPRADRRPRSVVEAVYGPSLAGVDPDDAMLRVLRAALRRFRAAGVEVMVVVMPVNVEHWRSVDLLGDGRGLEATLRTMRESVESSGAAFVDLHALLEDAAFRDAYGHFTFERPIDGYQQVVEELAPAVHAWLESSGSL